MMADSEDGSSSNRDFKRNTIIDDYSYDILSVSSSIFDLVNEAVQHDIPCSEKLRLKNLQDDLSQQKDLHSSLHLKFKDLQLLHGHLLTVRKNSGQDVMYLHDILIYCDAKPILPQPVPEERSPQLEARMEKLRRKFAEDEYQKMTKNVSSSTKVQGESVGKELKKMDSQVMFMFNFVITVLAAFAFGYKATEYSLSTPNVSLQLIVGMVLATAVFFADVYFIIKDYGKETPSLDMNK